MVSDQGSEESRHRGESQVGEVSISKVIDKSSVYILQNLLQGVSIDNAQIDMTTTEGDQRGQGLLFVDNDECSNHQSFLVGRRRRGEPGLRKLQLEPHFGHLEIYLE